MKTITPPCKTLIASAIISMLSCSLAAQDKKPNASMAEITVTSTSILPSNLEQVPGSYSVVTKSQLDARAPFSILEIVREIPGLHVVSEDGAGTHLNVGMRGLNPRRSSRTLMLEDGAPTVFFAPYGDPSSHYSTPLDRIERIEVLKGSGQILYGPQTMGGMINYVTRPVPTQGASGSVKLSGGNNGYYDGHFNIGSGTENGGLMLDALQRRGNGIRAEHDFDVQEVALKGHFKISRDQRITGKFSNFQEKSGFSETGLTATQFESSRYRSTFLQPEDASERFNMTRNTWQLVHALDLKPDMKLTTQLYHSKTDRASRRSREFELDGGVGVELTGADAYAVRPRRYEFFGIEPKLEFKHTALGLKNLAVIGARYHEENIDRKKFTGSSLNVTHDADERLTAKIKALSYYAQNTFISGDWTFTPGLRIEDVTSKKNLYSSSNGTQFDTLDSSLNTSKTQALPGFGMTWSGLSNATVFGGVHRGFAPPRPDRDIGDAGLQRVSPELSTTTEVGIRSGLLQSGYVEGTLFHMAITDLVVQSGGVFRNEGKAQHTGYELSSKVNFGELAGKKNNYFATVAYTHLVTAKFKGSGEVGGEGEDGYGSYTSGNRLPYAPEHTLALNVSYENQQGLLARLGMTHVSKQFANTENFTGTSATGYCPSGGVCGLQGEIPALTLFNASLAYAPKGQRVTYFLNGENLMDKKYFSSRANGLQAGRGRMVVAGLRYGF